MSEPRRKTASRRTETTIRGQPRPVPAPHRSAPISAANSWAARGCDRRRDRAPRPILRHVLSGLPLWRPLQAALLRRSRRGRDHWYEPIDRASSIRPPSSIAARPSASTLSSRSAAVMRTAVRHPPVERAPAPSPRAAPNIHIRAERALASASRSSAGTAPSASARSADPAR